MIPEIQNPFIEHLTDLYNQVEATNNRYSQTYLEMSNTLNWVITLVTAQFLFFIDKMLIPLKCNTYYYFTAIGATYICSIAVYIIYKTQYVKFKKITDDIIFNFYSNLIHQKDLKRFDKATIEKINQAIELGNKSFNTSVFKIAAKADEIDDKSFIELGAKISNIDVRLKFLYKLGMWVSVPSLIIVPLFVVNKYFF